MGAREASSHTPSKPERWSRVRCVDRAENMFLFGCISSQKWIMDWWSGGSSLLAWIAADWRNSLYGLELIVAGANLGSVWEVRRLLANRVHRSETLTRIGHFNKTRAGDVVGLGYIKQPLKINSVAWCFRCCIIQQCYTPRCKGPFSTQYVAVSPSASFMDRWTQLLRSRLKCSLYLLYCTGCL